MARLKTPKEIGAALRARRKALGLTQAAAASRIGSTQRWVSQIENGKERAEIGAVLRLAEALELAVTDGGAVAAPEPGGARQSAYRAYVDAYRAALRCAGERAGGRLAPSEIREASAAARRAAQAVRDPAKIVTG